MFILVSESETLTFQPMAKLYFSGIALPGTRNPLSGRNRPDSHSPSVGNMVSR